MLNSYLFTSKTNPNRFANKLDKFRGQYARVPQKQQRARAHVNTFRTMMTLMKSSNYPINPKPFFKEVGAVLTIEIKKMFTANRENDVPCVLLLSSFKSFISCFNEFASL